MKRRTYYLTRLLAAAVLASAAMVGTSAVTTTQPAGATAEGSPLLFLYDIDGTNYNWSTVAPEYETIELNAWNYDQISQIHSANPWAMVAVYKDLSSTRSSDTTDPRHPATCSDNVNGGELATGMGWCWAMQHHPDWFLTRHGASGTCGPTNLSACLTERGLPSQYEMDYGNADYQKTWDANVISDMNAHGWNEVFADNALDVANAYGLAAKYTTDASVQSAMGGMLASVGPGVQYWTHKRFIANVGFDTEYPSLWASWLPYTSGLEQEYTYGYDNTIDQSHSDWRVWENEISTCNGTNEFSTPYVCYFKVGGYQDQPKSVVDYGLSSYLLYNNGYQEISYGDTIPSEIHQYPEQYRDFGNATDSAHAHNYGAARDFVNGSTLVYP